MKRANRSIGGRSRVYRVVVDVIHGGPEMIIATHGTVGAVAPDLAAAGIFLAVPEEGCPAVEFS